MQTYDPFSGMTTQTAAAFYGETCDPPQPEPWNPWWGTISAS
jgi:hypothetical protein